MTSSKQTNWLLVAFTLIWSSVVYTPAVLGQSTPQIDYLFPSGAQRGTEVEVQLVGKFMPGDCRVSLSGKELTQKPGRTKDQHRFAIAAEAALEPCEVRLVAVQGASPPFPFLVGDLPEVIHNSDREPLELKLPVTANGRLKSGGRIDEYSVTLSAGTQIVCAATTRAIRSPVDATLRLLDVDRKPVAESISHRTADALLVFRAKTAGRYILQVFDFQLSGGDDFIYRLTVMDGPWIDYVFPAGVQQNVESAVTVRGWNLPSPSGNLLEYRVPAQPAGSHEIVLPGCGNRCSLPVGPSPELVEIEPNDLREQAQLISIPTTVNGRLNSASDVDIFSFMAAKGNKFVLEVDSAELKFPTDIVLTISNADGKTIVEADDNKTSRDPLLRFTVPAAGQYLVAVRNRVPSGGEDFVYRLRCAEFRPDVTARINTSSLLLHSGETTNLPVIVERVDGFADDLELLVTGLPTGISVAPQAVPAKTPATNQLPFAIAEKLAPVGGLVRVVLRKVKPDEPWERVAQVAESAAATVTSAELWLAVSPKIPFTLKTTTTILDAPRLAAFPFPVTVKRDAGFSGPIRLVGVEPDRRGTLLSLAGTIAAASETGAIPLVLQHKVTEGTTHRCRVMGIAEVLANDGQSYPVFHIAGGTMSVGCQPSFLTLTVAPSILTWRPDSTQSIAVQLTRRTSMQPIHLKLSVPATATGITCEPVVVAADQNQASLTVQFSPNAVLPPRTTLSIQAESSRDSLPIYGQGTLRLEAEK